MLVAFRLALVGVALPGTLVFLLGGLGAWLTLHLLSPFQRLPVLAEIELEDVDVAFEAERINRPQQILTVDGLTLFVLTLFAGFAGDERNELRNAFLNCFLGVFGDLSVLR